MPASSLTMNPVDMAKMAADPTTQKSWSFCEPCQSPIPIRKEGE